MSKQDPFQIPFSFFGTPNDSLMSLEMCKNPDDGKLSLHWTNILYIQYPKRPYIHMKLPKVYEEHLFFSKTLKPEESSDDLLWRTQQN